MNTIQNVVEYYDELYPITEAIKKFYENLIESFQRPVRFLRIGCATGYLEHLLAREGHDVTGLETSKEMLESANLKRRNQLMSIRFFQMSTLDMTRFLGKGFYNVISCLNDRIIFVHDQTLLRKFFFDCKQLMAPNGKLILQLANYSLYENNRDVELPVKESLRAKLYTGIEIRDDGEQLLSQELETGNGRIMPIEEQTPVYMIKKEEIIKDAEEAGFTRINFYSDYELHPFEADSKSMVVVLE